ncbi:MAG: penicillin acylase family protein [Ignavibacteria bacterium]|nr:penicillin acylase family protein [Ignavibacteria bacterium]
MQRAADKKKFYDAVSSLIAKHGSDMNKWQWGDLHNVYMKHPLGIVPEFSSMLNIGPFKSGGTGTTVNNLEYSFPLRLKQASIKAFSDLQ